jgi:hypothetical protein
LAALIRFFSPLFFSVKMCLAATEVLAKFVAKYDRSLHHQHVLLQTARTSLVLNALSFLDVVGISSVASSDVPSEQEAMRTVVNTSAKHCAEALHASQGYFAECSPERVELCLGHASLLAASVKLGSSSGTEADTAMARNEFIEARCRFESSAKQTWGEEHPKSHRLLCLPSESVFMGL